MQITEKHPPAIEARTLKESDATRSLPPNLSTKPVFLFSLGIYAQCGKGFGKISAPKENENPILISNRRDQ